MEKQKRWQFVVILLVLFLTLYNILPTIIYYSKPLKSPIGEKEAVSIEQDIASRVNGLEPEAKDWLESFCDLLNVSPKTIRANPKDPLIINITNPNAADLATASLYHQYKQKLGQNDMKQSLKKVRTTQKADTPTKDSSQESSPKPKN